MIPDDEVWDIRWSEQFFRIVGSDTGPQGCCACGAVVQTDLVARRTGGGQSFVPQKLRPPLTDPAVARHVPWVKARVSASSQGCHIGGRVYWSDIGRIVTFGSDKACVDFVVPLSDTQQWYVDPPPGTEIDVPAGSTAWQIWITYEITCCACQEDHPARLTDSAAMPDEETLTFVAMPYATSFTLYANPALGAPYTMEIVDAAGNVLWTTTTTAEIYAAQWPTAHALRITGDRNGLFTIVWES